MIIKLTIMSDICNCRNTENDICFKCLDNVLKETEHNIIRGRVGKKYIDSLIELKTSLIDVINDPDANIVKNTQLEITKLTQFREIQKND